MRTMSSLADIAPNGRQLVETPDINGAYPRLSDEQIATLESGGTRRAVHTGSGSDGVALRKWPPYGSGFQTTPALVAAPLSLRPEPGIACCPYQELRGSIATASTTPLLTTRL